ncbi:MAG: hypothetical protein ACYC7D_09120 [Nitrososphaerales archaeon]
MPRKKFDQEAANKLWSKYTEKLINSISESEKEGLENGYSSYEIERLWQKKVKQSSSDEKEKD